uniref:Protein sleepless n=1 Tax=Anopheles atroparvus TaxID=41427 RepID=A0A182J4W5_ANOAO
MKQRVSDVTVVATFLGVLLFLASPASSLRCYTCVSGESWSDCQSTAVVETCSGIRQVSILEQNIFLPAQARQLDLACLSLSAEGTLGAVKGYAYLQQCFYNDKTMCSLIQDDLPPGFRVLTCELCTEDLCNGASSVTIAFSSVLLMAVAVMLRK